MPTCRYPSIVILALSALLTNFVDVANGMISEECSQEMSVLQQNDDLSLAFDDLLKEYKDDVEHFCDFSSSNIDCGLDSSAENATFSALCLDAGGKIFDLNLGFKCDVAGVAKFEVGIGQIPFCVGTSCNTTAWQMSDLNDTRLDDFLDDISFSSCDATVSSGVKRGTNIGLVAAALFAPLAASYLK